MDSKPANTPAASPNAHVVAMTLTFCAISLVFILLVYGGEFAFGSRLGNWTYPYFKTISAMPVWIPASVAILLGITIFIGSRLIQRYEKVTLLGSFLGTLAVQVLIHRVYPIAMGAIVESDTSNSFYSLAVRYSPLEILSGYLRLAPSFPLHARTNMPGKILLLQLFTPFTTSPRIMGYLVIALSALGAFLLYGICMQLFHERKIAFYAFVLYALVPARLFFFPILNTVTPLFILLCLYLFLAYLERKQAVFLILLGAALYLLVLYEPTPLVSGVIFVGVLLKAIGDKRFVINPFAHPQDAQNGAEGIVPPSSTRSQGVHLGHMTILSNQDWLALLVFPALGFLAVYLLFSLIFSFDLWQAFRYVLNDAVDFNTREARPYWIWVIENPKEFFYVAGLPVMMIFTYLVIHFFTQRKSFKDSASRWSIENVFLLSLLATLFTVVLLGVNRGEITRLWIYLAVFFQIPAAAFLGKIPKSEWLFLVIAGMLALQSLVTLQRVGFIIP